MSGIPQIEKYRFLFQRTVQVTGQSGLMYPGAYFREVNNLNCAQRGGVALQHKENWDEKGKFPRAKGISRIIPN